MEAAICSSRLSARNLLLKIRERNTRNPDSLLQLIEYDAKYSELILDAAEKLALDAQAAGVAVSDRVEIEFLLWLAKTPHVKSAVEKIGVKEGGKFIAVMIGKTDEGKFSSALKSIEAERIAKLPEKSTKDLIEIEQMALARINE